MKRDPLGDHGFLTVLSKSKSARERKELKRQGLEPAYLFCANDAVFKWDDLGLRVQCGCSVADARELAVSLSLQYYLSIQVPLGVEAGGKICCACGEYVYAGTVVQGTPNNIKAPIGQSECQRGDPIIAIWHTHPQNEPWQLPRDQDTSDLDIPISIDRMAVVGFDATGRNCQGIISYMRNTTGRMTQIAAEGGPERELDL